MISTDPGRPAAPRRSVARRILRGTAAAALIGGFALTTFEVLYRMQVVDTYAPELRLYNPPGYFGTSDGRPTALFMGDSFTAGTETYPALLRATVPGARFVNAAISGTGIVQTAIAARERFARFRPKVFVYQVYVGNDLFDITYPINWGRSSFVRNVYWTVAQRFRSLGFVNYRLGQLGFQHRKLAGTEWDTTAIDKPFSPALYSPRSRIYFLADPKLVEQTALVEGTRKDDFASLVERLHPLLAHCAPRECTAYIIVIPDGAQVTPEYLRNSQAMGAVVEDAASLQATDYPFFLQLRSGLRDVPNVTVLNPIEALRNSERAGVRVYHSNDGHLNSAGQHILADFLAPYVASSLGVTGGGAPRPAP
jgi:hypothetical protein